jgi:predicted metal-dependent hydrolase
MDMHQLTLGNLTVEVIKKDIKNTHLRVYPPTGIVRISTPLRMDLATIRKYVVSKLSWIKKQQLKINRRKREVPSEFLGKESHYFNGKIYLLKVIEHDATPKVMLKHNIMELYVRPHSKAAKKQEILDDWCRNQLKEQVISMINQWEKKMNIKVDVLTIRKMKTRWGSCHRDKKKICLNLELVKKPSECIEYVVVHELAHFFEGNHGTKFKALMDDLMPKWRSRKEELNRLPVGHVDWKF